MGVLGCVHDTKAGLHGDEITPSLMLDRKGETTWFQCLCSVNLCCIYRTDLLAIHTQTCFAMVEHMWLEFLLGKWDLQEAPCLSTGIELVQ